MALDTSYGFAGLTLESFLSPFSPSNLTHLLYSVLAVFLEFFLRVSQVFPTGYRMFPCLWALMVPQYAECTPFSLYVFLRTANQIVYPVRT